MTKKEFKKKCKEEKLTSYRLSLYGAITVIIGAIIVFGTLFFGETLSISTQIFNYIIGGIVAFIGMIIDLIGEIKFSKAYKEYKNK